MAELQDNRRTGATLHEVKIQACPDTVELLETLLRSAKSGEIIGLAFAATKRGNKWSYGMSGAAMTNPCASLGAANRLVNHINKSMD